MGDGHAPGPSGREDVLGAGWESEFGWIAEVLDVSVPGARQLASPARRRVAKAKQSMPQVSKAERERVLAVFRAAYEAGTWPAW
ncbi:hypothetical protein [Streptomyces sp. Inha503]|uniref:hypothetical protein n=1 Tax=Streptomyces sp. Inha503 TaxID=3383314 RepID=UPI0039A2825C